MRLASTALPISATMPSRLRLTEAAAAHRVAFAQGQRAIGIGYGRRRRPSRRRQGTLLLQRGGMAGDRVGDLPHQAAQFADLGGDRIDRAARLVHGALDPAFHGDEPARHLAHLAGEVGGAARQIGDLVADIAAVAQAAADGIVECHGGERGQRHDRRGELVHLEAEIEHGADRAGDEHHADRNEDGADTTHEANPGPDPGPSTGGPDSQPRTPMSMTPRVRATSNTCYGSGNSPVIRKKLRANGT